MRIPVAIPPTEESEQFLWRVRLAGPLFWGGFWFFFQGLWVALAVQANFPGPLDGEVRGVLAGLFLIVPPPVLTAFLARMRLGKEAITWITLQFVWLVALSELAPQTWANKGGLTGFLLLLAYLLPPLVASCAWLAWRRRRTRLCGERFDCWFAEAGGVRTSSGFRLVPATGTSPEEAILVAERYPGRIPPAEYEFLLEHRGISPEAGYQMKGQVLLQTEEAVLDRLTVVTPEGEEQEFHFDITSSALFS
jgi:hypothetical protein